ncbi:hypothetical protein ACQZ4U_14310, partial [Agrobacterium vitis]
CRDARRQSFNITLQFKTGFTVYPIIAAGRLQMKISALDCFIRISRRKTDSHFSWNACTHVR